MYHHAIATEVRSMEYIAALLLIAIPVLFVYLALDTTKHSK
jgi:hypothetical protein